MKHNPNATANALAVTSAILYAFCRLAISLFPSLTTSIAQSWFHGLEINMGQNLAMSSFILGLVTFTIAAWLTGYLFAKVYNFFLKK